MKITFTMTPHENRPKHSTRFEFEGFEPGDRMQDAPRLDKFRPSFYVPKPVGETARRIRVTIEEL